MLPKFDIHRPATLPEALRYLADHQDRRVKVLAGGTDLLVDMRLPVIPNGTRPPLGRPPEGIWEARSSSAGRPEVLCALWRLNELRGIRIGTGVIRIGALTTIAELERSPVVREHLPALGDGARQLGSAPVRNRGTYGGNLCNGRPAADTAIPTIAHRGQVQAVSLRGERNIPAEDFIIAPGRTALEPDEIVSNVIFDLPSDCRMQSRGAYLKLAQRKSLEIAVVGVAGAVWVDRVGQVSDAVIALGAVGPRPLVARQASEALIGSEMDESQMLKAAVLASEAATPITDYRGGKDYRSKMVAVLTRRVLEQIYGA
ncbi:MAG: xanthine dehydrogenase family protein subunit M [Calditrichaeota bacterium]|nr:xanthine dehydrogenase family protein subunit M [Calditrichota bacterium]